METLKNKGYSSCKGRFYQDNYFLNGYKFVYDLDIETGGTLFVYSNDEKIAEASIHFNYGSSENIRLKSIAVNSEYRLKGIGSTMINEIIKLCKQNGISKIVVYSIEGAINFYKKCGFIEDNNQWLHINVI